jgi:hypothetical protein
LLIVEPFPPHATSVTRSEQAMIVLAIIIRYVLKTTAHLREEILARRAFRFIGCSQAKAFHGN